MKEKLTNNLAIKLIALFCAFFVWLAVVNVANPIKVSTREVPVTITNDQVLEQADLAYDVVGKKTVVICPIREVGPLTVTWDGTIVTSPAS